MINDRGAAHALQAHKDPQKAAVYRRYFKDTTGEAFLGVATPILRRIAREFWSMPLAGVRRLMESRIHEERSLANEVLRLKFEKGDPRRQQEIFDFYIRNRRLVCSWDCVDGSAPYIVGYHLLKRDKKLLYGLAASPRIWDRRIAIVATLWFIRRGNVRDTLKLAKMLLHDEEDLIHKATAGCCVKSASRIWRRYRSFWTPIVSKCRAPCCAMPLSDFRKRNGRNIWRGSSPGFRCPAVFVALILTPGFWLPVSASLSFPQSAVHPGRCNPAYGRSGM